MIEVLRTNDPVLISYVEATLKEFGIQSAVLDTNISIIEGSIGIFPRRLMVINEDAAEARRILLESEAAPNLTGAFVEGSF